MKRLFPLLAIISATLGLAIDSARAELSQWKYNPTTGHVYALTDPGTWDATETQAAARGGHLVTVNDAAENTWLNTNYVDGGYRWIGFSDAAEEGKWVWSDPAETGVWYHPDHPDHGTVVNAYANWKTNEPGYPNGEDHAHFYSGQSWNDTDQTNWSWQGIYESDRTSFAEPTWQYNANTNRYYGTTTSGYATHAQAYAESIGAHLVTINDGVENDYVRTEFASQASPYLWVGIQNVGTAPNGPWQWPEGAGGSFHKVNGGDAYTNWDTGEPSGDGPATMMYVSGTRTSLWNDVPYTRDYRPVLERDAEVPTWTLNPENGHLYTVIDAATHGNSWNQAEALAQRWGAHLATVDNAAENDWIRSEANLPTGNAPYKYIGMHNAAADNEHWEWISGEGGYWDLSTESGTSYVYWNRPPWAGGNEPSSAAEDAVMIYRDSGLWNDVSKSRNFPAIVEAAGLTETIYSPVTGKGYVVLGARMSWENADQLAQQLGYPLATIGSAAENEWLRATFAEPLGGVWIGLNDAAVEGEWQWASGLPTGFFNWAADGQLGGNSLEDYVYLGADGQWRDRDGVNMFYAILQVPEPSSALLLSIGGLLFAIGRRRR